MCKLKTSLVGRLKYIQIYKSNIIKFATWQYRINQLP